MARFDPGTVTVVTRILDAQTPASDGSPDELIATQLVMYGALAGLTLPGQSALPAVTYVALPGPQYETAVEVEVLQGLGAQVVGMSTAAEVRAAAEEGIEVAVVSVVTNAAGEAETGGAAVHAQVIDVSGGAVPRMLPVLDAVLEWWARGG